MLSYVEIMIRKKNLIAIIPVKKKSKGIQNKNILKINNKTLLERKILLSKKNKYIDKTIVSTDCKFMFKIAKKHSVNDISLRPKNLSTDKALTIDVINHIAKKQNLKDVYIILLQVSSPFSSQKLLNKFLKEFDIKKTFNSSVSVSFFNNPHPYKVQQIKNGKLSSFLKKESMVPRQFLPKVYKLNGLFYISHLNYIKKNKSFFNHPVLPNIIEKKYSLNLDENDDLIIFKEYLKNRKFLKQIN